MGARTATTPSRTRRSARSADDRQRHGAPNSRRVERVSGRLNVDQLAALMGSYSKISDNCLPASVSNLYASGGDQLDSPRRQEPETAPEPLETGSDCWTRTSDPVINSHLLYQLS